MLNSCQFIGHLGRDPEIRSMNNGGKVCSLSLGVTESWKNKQTGEKQSKTEWVKISIFNEGLVNVCQNYLKKGSKIYACGKMQTRKWQGEDGTDKYTTEIVMNGFGDKIIMLDSRNDSGGGQSGNDGGYGAGQQSGNQGGGFGGGSSPGGGGNDFDDEIPF